MLPHGYQHIAAYAELEKTSLEWTAFNIGWFLEYFGMPNVKTYIQQTTFVVDMAALCEKFIVTYDSVEKLQSGEITELPGQVAAYSYFPKEWVQKLFSVFGYWVTEGVFDFPEEKALNKLFPDIKVTTVKDMLNQSWGGK
ncbi:hypothetical protein QQX98_004381 [Neonectria punicea]|uniref:NmrA-like domain-containing protein n=1 Tax=Neonectria punicea TaxID=979145 RepID=A0ABR1H9N1_9HYPO